MTSDDTRVALLAATDHLEWWADSLPRRSSDSQETWYEFLDRRYAAEMDLIERLRRAPDGRLEACPRRMNINLTLAGLRVRTNEGLEAALRAWVSQARERWAGENAPKSEPS